MKRDLRFYARFIKRTLSISNGRVMVRSYMRTVDYNFYRVAYATPDEKIGTILSQTSKDLFKDYMKTIPKEQKPQETIYPFRKISKQSGISADVIIIPSLQKHILSESNAQSGLPKTGGTDGSC